VIVLEDLGTVDAEAALATAKPSQRHELMNLLLRPLEILAGWELNLLPNWNAPLDQKRLRWELAGFELWYVRHLRSRRPTDQLNRWLDRLAATIDRHPRRVCHRDYHLNNLLIQPDGAVGIIDIQDILIGPDTYDVVSLVAERAALKLLPRTVADEVLASWAERTGAANGWRERVTAVQLQRGLEVLGSFARFVLEGQDSYTEWLNQLAPELAVLAEQAGAPPDTTAFLLD
jgi:aminoglycoside/choline kinase family phosphotransferase